MASLEQLKDRIKRQASENPEEFFATDVLKEKGFSRGECSSCGMFFWSYDEEREVCGEPECTGGYSFINDSPTDESFGHTESWELFRDFMQERGYESIDRYPTIARWRDDVEFTGASIYCFQPYVVSGEAEPPADELVIPQPSLRFNDVDNVGITGRHYTNFTMIGQTCFQPPEKYDIDRYFRDMFEFAVDGMGIPQEKLILHEDSWGGGGNLGPCMEFFVDGLELWNQVYMLYEQTPDGYEELDLQVLDMGMGHERITWISNGTETSYECVMPETLEKMKDRTGVEVDEETWEKFLPYSSLLNIDEVDDIDEKWEEIAEDIGMDVDELKQEIKPTAALYAVAEHARSLLFALADGKLPSNTGGGHNLRMVYRRAEDFIERYDWDLEIRDIAEYHAEELEEMYPELLESIDEVKEILEVEKEKYRKSRMNARQRLSDLDGEPSVEEMVELYESHGVSPEMMREAGYTVPEDFYSRITEDGDEVSVEEKRFDLETVEDTDLLFYEDEEKYEMNAEVVEVLDGWVVLDRTVFYPEGGGQDPDRGVLKISGEELEVTDVQKQDGVVLHKVPDNQLVVEEGDIISGKIDGDRRYRLMQHHSVTHMVNGATKNVLGEHIWQAGASKSPDRARLDVTHYENIGRDTLDRIESEVRKYIIRGYGITKTVMEKSSAEQKYGFRIYQGGAPPGNEVRIVKIRKGEDLLDVEACGGTHLSSTTNVEEFVITGSNKVQDGVIRIEYKAGEAAENYINSIRTRISDLSDRLDVEEPDNHRKAQRDLEDVFSVEPEQLEKTVEKFYSDIEDLEERIELMAEYLDQNVDMPQPEGEELIEKSESLFETRKEREKLLEGLEKDLEGYLKDRISDRELEREVPTSNISLLIQIARKLAKGHQASVTLIGKKGAVSASYHEDIDAVDNLKKFSEDVQGDQNFAKTFNI